MKKSLFISLICVIGFFACHAQHFTNGLGISVLHDETKFSGGHPYIGLAYTAGVTFKETTKFAFSVTAPFRAGYSSSYFYSDTNNIVVSDDWQSVIVQLPLVFNFNYGAGSSQKARARVGFFGGAGYGAQMRYYHEKVTFGESITSGSTTAFSTGAAFNAGIRLAVGNSYRRRNIEAGIGYFVGVTGEDHNLISFHCLYNF